MESKDKFELDLEEKLLILKNCQSGNNTKSCFECEQIFECQTRKNYVDAVYASMSKGASGGFEF